MSTNAHPNPSSKPPGVGTKIKGTVETIHGVGENIRGRTLGAIDDLTHSGTSESKSRYVSMAERGRMEVEMGMARIHGDPDPHGGKPPNNEPGSLPHPVPGALGNEHATGTGPGTGYTQTGEHDYYAGGGGVDNEVRSGANGAGRGTDGYGTNDGYGPAPGVHNQQPAINRNTEMGPDPRESGGQFPNNASQNVGHEAGGPASRPQAGALTPPQQSMERDSPPGLPPRSQGQAIGNDQHGQTYQ